MALELTEELQIKDEHLLEAVAKYFSPCFGALSICNALAGTQDTPWKLLYKYKIGELLAEIDARGIDLQGKRVAVENNLIIETERYKAVRKEMAAS